MWGKQTWGKFYWGKMIYTKVFVTKHSESHMSPYKTLYTNHSFVTDLNTKHMWLSVCENNFRLEMTMQVWNLSVFEKFFRRFGSTLLLYYLLSVLCRMHVSCNVVCYSFDKIFISLIFLSLIRALLFFRFHK